MDISIFSNFAIAGIFLPLVFGLYLLISRLRLSFVDKKVLNWGCAFVNLISLIIFFISYFVFSNESLNCAFNLFSLQEFSITFGFLIDKNNSLFLVFSSLMCLIVSFYSKKYFDKKRQFIFTKQRYFAYLSCLSSLLYIFLASLNLFQAAVILILQSVLIFAFAYVDIFKNSVNLNAIRFQRIANSGNFLLLIVLLILFRYTLFSQGYIASDSLEYSELESLMSYTYGVSTTFEFILIGVCFFLAIASRLAVFPFSCYYSFFANSSNIFYLSVFALANNLVGVFLFLKLLPLAQIMEDYIFYFEIFIALGVVFALVQVLFEQNIKIIFGYLISFINSVFIILFLNFNPDVILCFYFVTCLILSLILMILFMKDKNNFPKRLINKNLGFIMERAYIFLFEDVFDKISKIFEIFYDKFLENILPALFKTFAFFASLFIIKTSKANCFKNSGKILIIFALIALFAIFIALFGGFSQ